MLRTYLTSYLLVFADGGQLSKVLVPTQFLSIVQIGLTFLILHSNQTSSKKSFQSGSQHVLRHVLLLSFSKKDEGVRELISQFIGPIPILIPLKLFLVTKLKFQNVISFDWINIFH